MQPQILYNAVVPRICPARGVPFFISVLFILLSLGAYSQSIPDTFKATVDSLLQTRPETFAGIHQILQKNREDTLLMRFVADTSAINHYAAGQAYGLNELGRAYRNISKHDRAIILHQEALEIAEKADNLDFRVYSLNNLGVVYRRISSIRRAMDYHQRALELAQEVEKPSKSLKRSINVSFNGIGNLYSMLGQYDKAIFFFEKSLRLEAELDNVLGLAVNHQNIGKSLEEQGKLDEALENYRTSFTYNDQIDNDTGRVICTTSIARIYLKKGRGDDALPLLDSILPLAKKLENRFLITPIYIQLGWGQMLTGDYKQAEENMRLGHKLAKESNLQETSANANHLLSELFQRIGDFKKALNFKLKADSLDREILNEGTIRYVNDVLLRYNAEKADNDMEILELELRTTKTTLLISGIALALLAGIFYILYRQYQLKNEKKLMTLEQSMLRSQMNPHFLFNSLNSIKLYIINNEQKNAVRYLNKFAKLVRKILEASSVREIPLAEELETVELYMTIENIRFSDEIDFKIEVDRDIDTHTIRIPSLIVQPFLENALWHGLSSKEGPKKVKVEVSREKAGRIQIAVSDNGIGRAAAEKIKQNKLLKRKSVGIEITKGRLANFAKDYQNSFQVEMLDLYDDEGKASGTKVVLHIPTT